MDCEECGKTINNVNITSWVNNGLHCFCSPECRKEYMDKKGCL